MSLRLSQNNPRFLIVNLRLAGDVLLSTPLALSLKQHYPEAAVDYLVYVGTEGVLAKNPHVRQVYTIQSGGPGLKVLRPLWRRYDVSIGTNTSDRTSLSCWWTGRHSLGFVHPERRFWWKRRLLSETRNFDGEKHAVPAMLCQLESLGVPPVPRVVMTFDTADEAFAEQRLGRGDYVLLHPFTRQPYKYWPVAAWAKLAALIRAAGLRPMFTQGVGAADAEQFAAIRQAVGETFEGFPESFTLNQLAAAIRRSRAFVGVDTLGMHMAAALEVPVVALFGPSEVRRWGPWPNGSTSPQPYTRAGIQRLGRVTVVQPDWPCVPCDKPTCAISTRNKMECLEQMSPETVLAEIKALLKASAAAPY